MQKSCITPQDIPRPCWQRRCNSSSGVATASLPAAVRWLLVELHALQQVAEASVSLRRDKEHVWVEELKGFRVCDPALLGWPSGASASGAGLSTSMRRHGLDVDGLPRWPTPTARPRSASMPWAPGADPQEPTHGRTQSDATNNRGIATNVAPGLTTRNNKATICFCSFAVFCNKICSPGTGMCAVAYTPFS